MDNVSIKKVAKKFCHLKFTFGGVWSANNFPKIAQLSARFQIINTSPSYMRGTHWILIVAIHSTFSGATTNSNKRRRGRESHVKPAKKSITNIVIWNSLPIPLSFYVDFYERVHIIYSNCDKYTIHEIASSPHPQSQSSNLCGMYCLYTALKIFEKIGHAYYNDSEDYISAMKQFRHLVDSAVKNIGLINEVNLTRFFNSRLQSKHTFKIM